MLIDICLLVYHKILYSKLHIIIYLLLKFYYIKNQDRICRCLHPLFCWCYSCFFSSFLWNLPSSNEEPQFAVGISTRQVTWCQLTSFWAFLIPSSFSSSMGKSLTLTPTIWSHCLTSYRSLLSHFLRDHLHQTILHLIYGCSFWYLFEEGLKNPYFHHLSCSLLTGYLSNV